MKNAEEVAKIATDPTDPHWAMLIKAINAFADGRLEEAAKICDEAIEREIEIGRGAKGHAVFQGQAAIDAVSDVSESIRALKGSK